MADATQVEDKMSEEISENTPGKKQETPEEMLSRHRYCICVYSRHSFLMLNIMLQFEG